MTIVNTYRWCISFGVEYISFLYLTYLSIYQIAEHCLFADQMSLMYKYVTTSDIDL